MAHSATLLEGTVQVTLLPKRSVVVNSLLLEQNVSKAKRMDAESTAIQHCKMLDQLIHTDHNTSGMLVQQSIQRTCGFYKKSGRVSSVYRKKPQIVYTTNKMQTGI